MKKSLKVTLIITLLLSSLVFFTGCEKEESKKAEEKNEVDLSAVAGTYTGKYLKLVGDTTKDTDEEFSLELKEDGTGVHNRDGASYKVTWSLDGDKFKMTEKFVGDPIKYTGTLTKNKLDIYNGDPDDDWTYEYVYTKEDESTKNTKKTETDDDEDNSSNRTTSKKKTTDETKTNDTSTDNTKTTNTNKESSTETTTQTQTTTENKENSTQNVSTNDTANISSEIRPEFKEAMDNYESFIDEYVEIVKKYKEYQASNNIDTSILTNYTNFMNRYQEVSKTFQKWTYNQMNTAEYAYYKEVYERTTQKIRDVNN